MKKLLFFLIILFSFSCGDRNKTIENQDTLAELQTFEVLKTTEEITRQFIEDYLRDLNSSDWKSKLPKYLQPSPEEFLEEHSAFRKSFSNYKATIKYLTLDRNEGIVWINITANYVAPYTLEKSSDYVDDILKGIKAENQSLSWDETWYFNVVDGKFGDKWDFLKDNQKIFKDLKANL